jgi:thiamine transport system permease protein
VLVPLAHALIGIPFVMRAAGPALHAVDPRLREAAAVLGAGPWRVWRQIDLALAGRAILVAAGFAFAISLGEFGATTVLARADTPTVTVTIGRLLGRPGAESFGQAAAMSVVLMVLTSAAVFAADRGRIGEIGTF